MNIKAFEMATGVPRTTIRFYEAKGLLAPEQSGRSGYRVYGKAQVERVKMIKMAQALGFSLAGIITLLNAWDANKLDASAQRGIVAKRLAEVEAKQAQLAALAAYLNSVLAWMDNGQIEPKPSFDSR